MTGTPILVGFINTGEGGLSFPEVAVAADTAGKYVNTHGGVNGRPIKLVTCSTTGAPESAGKCANDLIDQKVAVAMLGVELGADALLKPLKEAGIPIFGVSTSGATLATDPSVIFTSPPASLTWNGFWKVMKGAGARKPILIGVDAGPMYKKTLDTTVVPSAKAAGLDLSYTLYNPAAPDFAAAVTAAKGKGADAIYFAGAEGDCTNGIKTARQLGWNKPIFAGSCTQFIKTLGSQAEGVHTQQYLLPANSRDTAPEAKQRQIDLYVEQMTAAGAKDRIDSFAIYGFADVMTLTDVLKGISGRISPATVKSALTTYKGDVFLGAPVDCSARPLPKDSCGSSIASLMVLPGGQQKVITGDFINVTRD
ncbi:ABC transporter substrate-binding protein [Streptomyces dioscori]|uniref:ABC transporter substrate-binding protein n=1 Tax=Streptomyces dioscori TaxID=2109333 RepID=UPI00131E57C9|nr:ABC transporter substrate-binding protein [Streptomyces dioscori]